MDDHGQDGVVSRRQLLAAGWTSRRVQTRLDSGRWVQMHRGVYATHTGPLSPRALAWAAVLACGEGAALAGRSALHLADAQERPPRQVEVTVPHGRKVEPLTGVVVTRRRGLAPLVHTVARPTRLWVEVALLDVVAAARDDDEAAAAVITAVQRRATTPRRVLDTLALLPRVHRRRLVMEMLEEIRTGVLSPLERRYLRDVHRRHALPPASFNAKETTAQGTRYRDVRYAGCVVELDGAETHPEWSRNLDRGRDNALILEGVPTLRFGWREVAGAPCTVAADVVRLLRLTGWTGTPRRCGRSCPVAALLG